MNEHVFPSLILSRLDHPFGRPREHLFNGADECLKKLRGELHEGGHAVACEWLSLCRYSRIYKDPKNSSFGIDCDLAKESRHIDLAITMAGPAVEQLFEVEAEDDHGIRWDFQDVRDRLQRDGVPRDQWRSELYQAITRAASIVEPRRDCVFNIALAFADTDKLTARQCREIIDETVRARPQRSRWDCCDPSQPSTDELRFQHALRKREMRSFAVRSIQCERLARYGVHRTL